MSIFAAPAAALLGVFMSVTAAMHGQVGRRLGTLPASFLFLFSGALLCLPLIFVLEPGAARALGDGVDWYLFLPGLFNLLCIANIVFMVNRIGTLLMTSTMFVGQVLVSIVLDHIGFLGLPVIPATGLRLTAALVLVIGIVIASVPTRARVVAAGGAVGGGRLRVLGATGAPFGFRPLRFPSLGASRLRGNADLDTLAVVLAFLQGCLLASFGALVTVLGQRIGVFASTFVYLAPGAVLVIPWILLSGGSMRLAQVRPRALLPGALNVLGIAGTVVLIPLVGMQLLTAALVTAAMLASLQIDRLGLFDVPRQAVSTRRVIAVIVLAVGVSLTVIG